MREGGEGRMRPSLGRPHAAVRRRRMRLRNGLIAVIAPSSCRSFRRSGRNAANGSLDGVKVVRSSAKMLTHLGVPTRSPVRKPHAEALTEECGVEVLVTALSLESWANDIQVELVDDEQLVEVEEIAGLKPVAPVIYPRAGRCCWALILEEGEERGLGLDRDDAVLAASRWCLGFIDGQPSGPQHGGFCSRRRPALDMPRSVAKCL